MDTILWRKPCFLLQQGYNGFAEVPLKIFLMKMKMLEKKQVVQEWSLQHQKNEVFDGIMEVWNKVNRPDVNGSGHKRAGQALINIPSHQSRCGCLPYLSSSP
ncbi:unnamed protein product [Brassica napus]|uniref:(rape) hypothetical protein n=1 Tax=Brassica napus TaxID=3708 RepID=A0A816U9Z7_BRANA|nr:unnamed protein product [Brassica napus]